MSIRKENISKLKYLTANLLSCYFCIVPAIFKPLSLRSLFYFRNFYFKFTIIKVATGFATSFDYLAKLKLAKAADFLILSFIFAIALPIFPNYFDYYYFY